MIDNHLLYILHCVQTWLNKCTCLFVLNKISDFLESYGSCLQFLGIFNVSRFKVYALNQYFTNDTWKQ